MGNPARQIPNLAASPTSGTILGLTLRNPRRGWGAGCERAGSAEHANILGWLPGVSTISDNTIRAIYIEALSLLHQAQTIG